MMYAHGGHGQGVCKGEVWHGRLQILARNLMCLFTVSLSLRLGLSPSGCGWEASQLQLLSPMPSPTNQLVQPLNESAIRICALTKMFYPRSCTPIILPTILTPKNYTTCTPYCPSPPLMFKLCLHVQSVLAAQGVSTPAGHGGWWSSTIEKQGCRPGSSRLEERTVGSEWLWPLRYASVPGLQIRLLTVQIHHITTWRLSTESQPDKLPLSQLQHYTLSPLLPYITGRSNSWKPPHFFS